MLQVNFFYFICISLFEREGEIYKLFLNLCKRLIFYFILNLFAIMSLSVEFIFYPKFQIKILKIIKAFQVIRLKGLLDV